MAYNQSNGDIKTSGGYNLESVKFTLFFVQSKLSTKSSTPWLIIIYIV